VTPSAAASLLLLTAGSALLLDRAPWFSRRSLVRRLEPYARRSQRRPNSAMEGLRELLTPGVERLGDRLSALVGADESLEDRLEYVDSATTPSQVRFRQAAAIVVSALVALAIAVRLTPAPIAAVLLVAGAPVLAALAIEHSISRAADRRRTLVLAELPVVVEQLGMLLGAGYSVTGAINRLAQRSDGVIASDLRRVGRRVGHGLSEHAALVEWADRSRLDAVQRLVGVLALRREAGDLSTLISQEARAVRAEAHRALVEDIERRAQLVWIPVTVATLVPGLILLAVPFMSALAQVTGTS
jgi:tight adherence protein C